MNFSVPKDRADTVAGLMILMGDRLARAADQQLSRWNIGESDYNVLRILNGAPGALNQVDIGQRLLCSRANVTKIVDRLQAKEFVRRKASSDRRENLVEITSKGIKFLRETIHSMLLLARESLSSLTDQQLIELEKLLLKLVKNNPDLNVAVHGHGPSEEPVPRSPRLLSQCFSEVAQPETPPMAALGRNRGYWQ